MIDSLKRDSFLWTSGTDKDQTVKVFSMDYSKVGGSSLQKCRLQITNTNHHSGIFQNILIVTNNAVKTSHHMLQNYEFIINLTLFITDRAHNPYDTEVRTWILYTLILITASCCPIRKQYSRNKLRVFFFNFMLITREKVTNLL